jgi:hypothetical protein
MPATISARLLFAARQAYEITANGPVPAVAAGTPDPGFGTPTGYVSGPDAIDAGLVGQGDDGIVVAFRGTLPFDSPDKGQIVRDWLSNVDAILVAEPGMPGLVHQGFRDALNVLWPAMQPEVLALARANPTLPLYVTGHSKGGAVANLGALRCADLLQSNGLGNALVVCTIAAPRAGNAAFATVYNATVQHSTRYEYADDIVPHVPPEDALRAMIAKIPSVAEVCAGLPSGFEPVGDLHYFARGSIVPVEDSPLLQVRRIASLAELMLTFKFDQIVSDHSIGPGSGYSNAIADGA